MSRPDEIALPANPPKGQRLARLLHPYHLSIASLMVFVIGVPTIFLTRFVFHLARPEYFERRLPTISKTSAFAPASYVFLPGMMMVAICVCIAWTLCYQLNGTRLAGLPHGHPRRRPLIALNIAAAAMGVTAGLSLALLSVITLQVSDHGHIYLSYVFFVSQLAAFLCDAALIVLLNRALIGLHGEGARMVLGGKPAVALIATTLGLFYLFMFLTKDMGIYEIRILAQGVYVLTEYILAIFCFAYAALYFPELRDHYRLSLPARS